MVFILQPLVDSCLCSCLELVRYKSPLQTALAELYNSKALDLQSRKGLTDTSTCPMYVCHNISTPHSSSASKHWLFLPNLMSLTYISAFSNRFFKFSLIASFETLLIKVRSETPTSFFLVVSNVAFLIFGLPDGAARPPSCAFPPLSPFGRRLIPWRQSYISICQR